MSEEAKSGRLDAAELKLPVACNPGQSDGLDILNNPQQQQESFDYMLNTSPLSQKENHAMLKAASLASAQFSLPDYLFKTPLLASDFNNASRPSFQFTSPDLDLGLTDTSARFCGTTNANISARNGGDASSLNLSKKRRKLSDSGHIISNNPIPTPSSEERDSSDPPKARNYKCNYVGCGLEFLSKGHLIRHTRVHNGERPFKCSLPDCDMTFPRSDTAIKHSRNHINKLKLAGHVIPKELHSPKVTLADPLTVPLPPGLTTRPYRKRKQAQSNRELKLDLNRSGPSSSVPNIASCLPESSSSQPASSNNSTLTFPSPARCDLSPLLASSSASPNEYNLPVFNSGSECNLLQNNPSISSTLWEQWLRGGIAQSMDSSLLQLDSSAATFNNTGSVFDLYPNDSNGVFLNINQSVGLGGRDGAKNTSTGEMGGAVLESSLWSIENLLMPSTGASNESVALSGGYMYPNTFIPMSMTTKSKEGTHIGAAIVSGSSIVSAM
ncbi:hypothetical protein BDR26DRAFT_861177 [Obelidium mucronatum]|nr:hypothetical protein BDR26DRAFT_861177 [Obelidium mucronatum]